MAARGSMAAGNGGSIAGRTLVDGCRNRTEQSDRGGGLEAEQDGDLGVGVRTKQGGLPVGPVRDP